MSNLRTLCRPHTVLSSFISCRNQFRTTSSFRNPNCKSLLPLPSLYSSRLESWGSSRTEPWFRVNQRRTVANASNWDEQKSPYETLGKFLTSSLFLFPSQPSLLAKWTKNEDFSVKQRLAAKKSTNDMIFSEN